MLAGYRDRLLAARDSCVLFDTPSLVRRLDELYRSMWAEYQDGRLPRPDLTNLDVYLEVGIEQDPEAHEVQRIEDYRRWWHEKLSRRNAFRPMPLDRRLWVETDDRK
jgi:hypothetical protein